MHPLDSSRRAHRAIPSPAVFNTLSDLGLPIVDAPPHPHLLFAASRHTFFDPAGISVYAISNIDKKIV